MPSVRRDAWPTVVTGLLIAAVAPSGPRDVSRSTERTTPLKWATVHKGEDRMPVGENVLAFISWNVQTGATSARSSTGRPEMVEATLGRMFKATYKLLAAQEIPDQAGANRFLGMLPPEEKWELAFVDSTDNMDNGFWFWSGAKGIIAQDSKALFTLSKDPDKGLPRADKSRAMHPPHAAHFTVENFDFTAITVHLTFEGGNAASSRRELVVLLDWLDEYFETEGHDPDVVICGDFNLPSRASGEKASGGLTIDDILEEDGRFVGKRELHVLVNDKTSRKSPANGSAPANNYDHFLISDDCFREEFMQARRIDPSLLTANDGEPKIRTSDHYPVVALFQTRGQKVHRDLKD